MRVEEGRVAWDPSPGVQPRGLEVLTSEKTGQRTLPPLGVRGWENRQVSDSGDCQQVLQPGPLLSPPPLPFGLAKCKLGPWGQGRWWCPAGHSGPCAHYGSSWSRGRLTPGGMLSAVLWSVAPLGASLCSDLRGSEGGVKQQGSPDSVELGQRQLPVLGRDPRGRLRLDPGRGPRGQLSASPGESFRLPTWTVGSTL